MYQNTIDRKDTKYIQKIKQGDIVVPNLGKCKLILPKAKQIFSPLLLV